MIMARSVRKCEKHHPTSKLALRWIKCTKCIKCIKCITCINVYQSVSECMALRRGRCGLLPYCLTALLPQPPRTPTQAIKLTRTTLTSVGPSSAGLSSVGLSSAPARPLVNKRPMAIDWSPTPGHQRLIANASPPARAQSTLMKYSLRLAPHVIRRWCACVAA